MRWIRIALLTGLAVAAASGWLSRETPRGSGTEPPVASEWESGSHFQNREGRLPAQPTGYYREYTVRTPGSPDRGARRIVSGGNPPVEFYYTDDHYRSFRRIEVPQP